MNSAKPAPHLSLQHELANCSPLPGSVNQVLSECGHSHPLACCLWLLSHHNGRTEGLIQRVSMQPTEPKTFASWPFMHKVCHLLLCSIKWKIVKIFTNLEGETVSMTITKLLMFLISKNVLFFKIKGCDCIQGLVGNIKFFFKHEV